MEEEFIGFSNVLMNLVLILVGVKIAIILHEIGHLIFARLSGGTPRRMVLGKGHEVAKKTFFNIKVIVNSEFFSGSAYAVFKDQRFLKFRLIIYTVGGVAVNFFTALLLIELFDLNQLSDTVHFPTAFFISSLITGSVSLIPVKNYHQGMRINSDGLSLLKIPFYSKDKLNNYNMMSEIMDALDAFEAHQYEKAAEIYEKCRLTVSDHREMDLNLSVVYLKLGELERSIELMEGAKSLTDEKKYNHLKPNIYNGLAWNYLLINELEKADMYSELAYKLDPNNPNIRGTRGAVLIENGNLIQGIKLLIDDVNFEFPNSQTLTAAFYLAFAYKVQGQDKKVAKYYSFVKNNLHKLDTDEKLLFDRISKKMETAIVENHA
jgi:tetratricopeptide (TPR) repeat protein